MFDQEKASCLIHEGRAFLIFEQQSPCLAEILSYFPFDEPTCDVSVKNQVTVITAVYGDSFTPDCQLQLILAKSPFEATLIENTGQQTQSIFTHKRLAKKTMALLHEQVLAVEKSFAVAIVGAGNVGRTLLQQIGDSLKKTYQDYAIQFTVKAIANSRSMLLSYDNIDINQWQAGADYQATDLNRLTQHIQSFDQEAIIIDATASQEVADFHRTWLEKGLHVITANKISCSGDSYHELMKLGQKQKVKYLFETTVGAGLPLIHAARNLADSGDHLLELQAILSGSLSYLFLELEKGHKFSELIIRLRQEAYTEPDPRVDLSGQDVARKLMILARQFAIDLQ